MRIVSIQARAVTNTVEPAIEFVVNGAYQSGTEVLTELLASVQVAAAKKVLGVARMQNPPRGTFTLQARAHGPQGSESHFSVTLVLALTGRVVEFLDEHRHTERKKDVHLFLAMQGTVLSSKAVHPHIRTGDGATPGKADFLIYENSNTPYRAPKQDLWLVSGDGSSTFVEQNWFEHNDGVVIGAGDWVHDYLGPWRATRYMVVELPQPELLTAPSAPNIEERVNGAIAAIRSADEEMQRGEWTNAITKLRPVWELVRNGQNQPDVSALLARDGYTPDAISAFNGALQNLFTLASKFVHRTDQANNLKPEIRAQKEDARLCFAIAVTAIDLIAKKTSRFNT